MGEWTHYIVSNTDFKGLVERDEVIKVKSNEFKGNCGVELYGENGGMINAIYDAGIGAIRKINGYNPVFNSNPNRDISLYNDFIINEDINTIIVDGVFGTGKTSTICSHIAAILNKGWRGDKDLQKVYILKPHESLGKGYGHLPGELVDKVEYEFKSYYQYINRFGQEGLAHKLVSYGILEVLVFEYLRGRDLDSGWVILDEAQNINVKEMVSFLSRVGDGAKLVILGDSSNYQIDKKGNSIENNGLSFVKKLYKTKKYAGYVELNSVNHILRGQRVKDMYLSMRSGGGEIECSI